MKKKLLAIALLVTMAVTAGCSGGSDKPAASSSPEPSKSAESSTPESSQPEASKPTESKAEESDSKAELEKLGLSDGLVIGLDDTFAPMGFRDENGKIVGFDIDMATAVCDIIGVPYRLQPIDWSMKETELNNKNIDLIWNAYTITPEREEKVAFSKPYLSNRQVVVVMKDSTIETLADLSGKVVAAQAESSAVDAINSKPEVKETFDGGEPITFETNNDCLLDLEAGRVDAVVGDEVLIDYYISKKGAENYKILDEDFGDELYGVGARKDNPALVDAVNAAFDELKENGEGAKISEKWFGEDKLK